MIPQRGSLGSVEGCCIVRLADEINMSMPIGDWASVYL